MESAARRFFAGLWLALCALALWPRLWSTPGLWAGWGGVCALLLAGGLLAARRGRSEGAPLAVRVVLRPRHIAQQSAQLLVYAGLAVAWPQLREQLPLTLAQVCVAYLLDALWVWRREPVYRLGLSPTPIVLSLNLFLWFRDEVFFWQWALLWVALRSRGWWRWPPEERGGRGRNVLNPSALALCVAALVLVPLELTHLTWGPTLAVQHGAAGEGAYLTIFLAGLVAHSLAPVGWVTLGGSLAFLGLGALFHARTGSYMFIDTAIPPAVFLGLNLLVTDPATSPRGRVAQGLFGAAYAAGAFALYEPLLSLSSPAEWGAGGELLRPERNPLFFDKVLAVPLLNVCVPVFERAGGWVGARVSALVGARVGARVGAQVGAQVGAERWARLSGGGLRRGLAYGALWSAVFFGLVWPQLVSAPGARLGFWEEGCARTGAARLCDTRDHLYALSCERGEGALCFNLAELVAAGEARGRWSEEGALERARPLWERSCALGALRGCVALGVLIAEGALPQGSSPSPRALWGRACWSEEGDLAARGQGDAEQGDAEQGDAEGGGARGEACFHLANDLGAEALREALREARREASREARREALEAARGSLRALRRACALGVPECAEPLERLTGEREEVRAWRCGRGDPLSCATLEGPAE